MVEQIDQDNEIEFNKDDFYNGIYNLKKAGIQVDLTEEQQEELFKCSRDPIYFIENYCYITSLDKGATLFKPFDYQKRAIRTIMANRFTLLKWPRQQGKTTTSAGILLWHAIFNKKYDIAIVAQQRGQAVEILDRIRDMYENLPWWMQVGVFSWNRGSIKLGNKSRIYTAAATSGGLRGKSCHLLFLDEFAWVQQDVEFYTATYPVVSSGTNSKIIIASTPNGMNLFYKLWSEAVEGNNAYAADQAHWYEHPARDEAWKEEQLKNMSERQFAQEFCVGSDTRVTISDGKETINIDIENLYDLMSLEQTYWDSKYIVNDIESIEKLMKDKPGIVYIITRSDGLQYVGITVNLNTRMKSHMRSSRFSQGIESIEILYEGTYSEASDLEEYFIQKYDTYKSGLNLTSSGKGKNDTEKFNTYGHKYSLKSRKKMSDSAKVRVARDGAPIDRMSKEIRQEASRKQALAIKGKSFHNFIPLEKGKEIINSWEVIQNESLDLNIDIKPYLKITQSRMIDAGQLPHQFISRNGKILEERFFRMKKLSRIYPQYNGTYLNLLISGRILAYASNIDA